MRLFVSVEPPEDVLDAVAALDRSAATAAAGDALRWARREQWHVTLRFLGELAAPEPVVAALAAAPLPRATAVVGPAAATFGRSVLHLPVAGLDALAAAVAAATAGLGGRQGDPPFRGHLTLARARGGRRLPHRVASLVPPLAAEFPVTRAHLVRSHLGPGGPRYERLVAVPLD